MYLNVLQLSVNKGIMLKTKYIYVHFVQIDNPGKKTNIWICRNNETNQQIGTVRWNGGWWKYTFKTIGIVEFDYICYEEIAMFLKEATKETKQGWKKKY